MKSPRSLFWLAALLLLINLGAYLWQNPGIWQGPIQPAEAQRYREAVARLPLPPAEREAVLQAVDAFMAQDDGRPFYMLNLMRYYPQLQTLPGVSASFAGTPQQSNAYYEDQVMPMLLGRGGYPAYGGEIHERNILSPEDELNDWQRLLLIRYPSRRAFMSLMSDPAYAPLAPYKLRALKVVLTPSQPELVLPSLNLALGAFSLLLFTAFGWRRASLRARRPG